MMRCPALLSKRTIVELSKKEYSGWYGGDSEKKSNIGGDIGIGAGYGRYITAGRVEI